MLQSIDKLLDFKPLQALERLGKICISVTEGVHTGAHVYANAGEIRVGNGVENDIVLFGDQVSENHYSIEIPRNPIEKTRIQAIDGPVEVNDRYYLNPGEYVLVRGNCRVRGGSSVVEAEHGFLSNDLLSNAVRLCIIITFLAMGWIALNVLGNLADRTVASTSKLLDSGANAATQLKQTITGNLQPTYRFSTPQVLQIVRAQLENFALNSSVRAENVGDSSIRVFGSVVPDKSGAWNQFLRWYDTNPQYPTLIRDVKRSETNPTLPVLQSVWLIDKPLAHFKDGTTAEVGHELANSWVVTEITRNWVTVERDGSSVRLKY